MDAQERILNALQYCFRIKEGVSERLFYRIRKDNFYGGTITADTLGCPLLCAYCWNYTRNSNPINVKVSITLQKYCQPNVWNSQENMASINSVFQVRKLFWMKRPRNTS